ncbi:MAG TPA: alpha/beta fold hydrolase [Lentisphaeria bacterium]|nr:alpha/beta fold hydrolase [Lentisphaeria bacterium]
MLKGLQVETNPTLEKAAGLPPRGLLRLEYDSPGCSQDRDWALVYPPAPAGIGIVVIHGHGSTGDQLYTRPDVKHNAGFLRSLGLGIMTPNLRGNAWMAPPAEQELADLIDFAKATYGWRKIILASGSMGGTSNLIFAARRPEMVDAVVANSPATDLARYAAWCVEQPLPVCQQIASAIMTAYHHDQALLACHSACALADRLTMPVWLRHGDADPIIPVSESRALAALLANKANFNYREIPDGGHDAAMPCFAECVAAAVEALATSCM